MTQKNQMKNNHKHTAFKLAIATLATTLTACQAPNMLAQATGMQMGNTSAKSVATGSAGGSTTTNANVALEHCKAPLGTISLVENLEAPWYYTLHNQYRLPPTASLLRLMIQQSNCFVVVERTNPGMVAVNRERDLQKSGEMRPSSNFGKGQMVASDFGLSPEVVFNEKDASGTSAMLAGLIGGGAGRLLTQVGASSKTHQASVLLTLVDNRSGVQLAAAEGSASKTDMAGLGAILGTAGGANLGGYGNTAQGKVIAAAFMDAYNNMVSSLREYRAQEVKGGLGKGGRLAVGK